MHSARVVLPLDFRQKTVPPFAIRTDSAVAHPFGSAYHNNPGLWMLPLGLMLIAQDVPFLQRPLANALGWAERKWLGRKNGQP